MQLENYSLDFKKIAFSDNFQAIFAVPLFCFRRKQGGYTFLYYQDIKDISVRNFALSMPSSHSP